MSQTERGWADPKARVDIEAMQRDDDVERLRYLADKSLRRDELHRQVNEPTAQELAAEEAQLP